MKQVASPGSMHDTGCVGLVYWDDPEGGYGEGGGKRFQDGEHRYTMLWIHFDIWQNEYNIVKFKNKIKLKKKVYLRKHNLLCNPCDFMNIHVCLYKM